MKIKEVRCYPESNFRLVNAVVGDKEFAYSHVRGMETFEVYHLDNARPSGFKYSRAYKMNKGERIPSKYDKALEFLREEFNKVKWQLIETQKLI